MYPKLLLSLEGIQQNAKVISELCAQQGIRVTGVVKSSDCRENTYYPILGAMKKGGIQSFGDSRMPTLCRMRQEGSEDFLVLLRVPMLSEVEDLVRYADASLQSEEVVLRRVNEEALKQNTIHSVLLMVDLGDLREGIYLGEELLEMARLAEDLPGLHLLGIGTNLGCYGCVVPDENNLSRLVTLAEKVEEEIGRKLELISGGATSSLPLLLSGKMPKRINHLRIGEGILLARDLPEIWGVEIPGMSTENYILQAEVIEIKEKPSHPIGEIFVDAYGRRKTFENKGMQRRCLVALGERDVGDFHALTPLLEGAVLLGASSDHGILDISAVEEDIQIGSIISFNLYYKAMMHAIESCSVNIIHC